MNILPCLTDSRPGPDFFSKLLKPMYSALRKLGHTNVAYIDDSFFTI